MKTKIAASLLLATLLSAGAFAQASDTNSSPPAAPNSPAPVVATPTQPTPPQQQAQVQAPAPASAPNQLVYVPRLPSAQELTNIAAAQGRTVERIEQNSAQIVLVYRDANGATQSVAYQLLPQAGITQPQQTTTVVAPTPAPTTTTVYYETAPRVVYYDTYPRYYYSPYWYPPVSLNLGFGYYRGWGGGYRGGWGGGYHGGWHGHR